MPVTNQQRIEVAPGRHVGWETVGEGPGLVVLHGAGQAGRDLMPLANQLRDRFSVHLVDRNGRGLSLPRDDAGGLAAQARDVAAVLEATGAPFLFGHSAGGMVALAAAAIAPVRRLAVYEPGISIDGSFPAAGRHLIGTIERGDFATGQVGLARTVGALPRWLPDAVAVWIARLLLATRGGARFRELAALVPPDLKAAAADDGPASRFAGLAMPALVMWGETSPEFLTGAAKKLAAALPEGEGFELRGQGHIAPGITAPHAVAAEMRRFFLGEGRERAPA